MAAPPVRGPRDVPELRDWLARQWRPGAPFALGAPTTIGALVPGADPARAAAGVAEWNRRALGGAALWWVTAELVDLVQSMADTLPATTLHPELVPAAPVLVVFARPLHGTDAVAAAEPVLVDAVMWDRSMTPSASLAPGRVPGVSVLMYRRADFAGMGPRERGHADRLAALAGQAPPELRDVGEVWLPLGRTDWREGDDWSSPAHVALDRAAAESMAEDRRWLAALWALAAAPGLVEDRTHTPDRATRRRAARAGYSTPDVRVVQLRGGVAEAGGLTREPGPGRTYRVRWIVRPHWRSQPYGPGRALRRPVLIAPYIKGPEGAPLHRSSTVHVLDHRPPDT